MVLIEQEKSEGSPRPPIRVYLRESGWAQAGVTHGHVSEFVPGVEDRTLGPVLAGVALALIQLLLASQTYFEANECDSTFKQRTVPKRWTLKGGAVPLTRNMECTNRITLESVEAVASE